MGVRMRGAWLLVAIALLGGSVQQKSAQGADPREELGAASDFRVRVSAALALGRSHAPDARGHLERALSDPHPTVRTAAAAALGALGDPAAVPALQRRLSSEPSESVRSQLRNTISTLQGKDTGSQGAPGATAGNAKTRYALQIGAMKNLSGVRGAELGNIMRASAQKRAAELPGAMLVEDASAAKSKGVPVLLLDGSLTKLAQQAHPNGAVEVTARVEFTVRKVPENTLKGALSGAATSLGSSKSLSPRASIALQDQAVEGAVESAMRGANDGLLQAAR